MSELAWRRLGYQRCHKCDSLVPEKTLTQFKDKSSKDELILVCATCANFKCFECGKKRNVRFYTKLKLGSAKWLCSWCARTHGVINDGSD